MPCPYIIWAIADFLDTILGDRIWCRGTASITLGSQPKYISCRAPDPQAAIASRLDKADPTWDVLGRSRE
ncbi:MAG: hypothetical protein AB4352_02250 [Hormoscilla sp.]